MKWCCLWLCLISLPVLAEDRLTKLQDFLIAVQQGVNTGHLQMEQFFMPDVMVTLQNGAAVQGLAQLREFLEQLSKTEGLSVVSYKTQLTLPVQTSNVRGTLVVQGRSEDDLELSDGLQFSLLSYWTAVMVWHDDGWKIAALHLSGNIFNNPIVDSASEGMQYAGMVGFALGLAAAWILYRTIRRQDLKYGRAVS